MELTQETLHRRAVTHPDKINPPAGPPAGAAPPPDRDGGDATALAVTTLALSGLAAGFALCMNVVHYRTWPEISTADFAAYQEASALHTVPAALAIGLPGLVWAVRLALRGLPGTRRRWLTLVAGMAAVPWIATPAYFVAMQQTLHDAGPDPSLVAELVWVDLALRVAPPILQTAVLAQALRRHGRANSAQLP